MMAREDGIRIIFTGPSGVEKKTVFEKIKDQYLSQKGIPRKEAERFIQRFSIEDEIKEVMDIHHISVFLSEEKPSRQKDIWEEALNRLLKKIKNVSPKIHTFIEMHTCYFYGHSRFRFWTFPEIASLNPTGFITLIDDAYSIWYRIRARELVPYGSYIRLQDIIEWRRIETLLTDLLACSLGVKNYVVAVKHPSQMLYRLLFEDVKSLLIYAAYPITEPRQPQYGSEGRKEIDDHRYFLHSQPYIVFDPLTIDERAFLFAFIHKYGEEAITEPPSFANEVLTLREADRWPLPKEFTMVSDPPDIFSPQSPKLPSDEVHAIISPYQREREALSVIDTQIIERDFRYISEIDLMVAYRPLWRGKESKGVRTEMQYSKGLAPLIVYHHPSEDRMRSPMSLFDILPRHAVPKTNKDDFYSTIAKHLEDKMKRKEESVWKKRD